MVRLKARSLWPFAALSLALHATSWQALHRASRASLPAFDATAETIAGDTLDIEPSVLATATPEEEASPIDRPPSPAPAAPDNETGTSAPPPPSRPSHATGEPSPSAAVAAPAPLFGAVGVRFATDLATTFTRAFPQAASADPLWVDAPLGAAGETDVTLVLDEQGHLASSAIEGSPSPALRRGIDRTLILVRARAFTARAAITRLHVRAHVARDEVHDGLHGDVFALSGGSFSGDVGTAFFALPSSSSGPGRRVDVEVKLVP